MPSTDHGAVYPDSSGSGNIATHLQNLADSAETALDTYETITSWTPTWDTAAGGGFTSVGGSGTNQGFYIRIGDWIWGQFRIELASGFAVDSGTFALILPRPSYVWGGSAIQGCVGSWIARNDSDPYHYGGPLATFDAACLSANFGGTGTSTPRNLITNTSPISWAAGDILSGVLNYRVAA